MSVWLERNMETRWAEGATITASDPASRRLTGYAATFNVAARIRTPTGDFYEMIERGAFRATLQAGSDIRLLVEHDHRSLLARTTAGNLTLSEDSKGLRFEVSLPDTQLGRDTYENVRVGNFSGMSFGFRPVKAMPQLDGKGGLKRVLLQSVDLREITITSLPAYPNTSVNLRPKTPEQERMAMRVRLARARIEPTTRFAR